MSDVFMTTHLKATEVFEEDPFGCAVSHKPEVQLGEALSDKATLHSKWLFPPITAQDFVTAASGNL